MIPLKEFSNTRRFTPSGQECPSCSKKALRDNWPPNYSGGGFSSDGTGYNVGTVKYVCTECKTAFAIRERSDFSRDPLTRQSVTVEGRTTVYTQPLVEREDGVWLTPHDVTQEEYKKIHGHYREEVYV